MGPFEPGAHVDAHGDKPAVVMARDGAFVTYRQLDERSKRVAQLLHSVGLREGDHIAIMMENHPRYFEIVWGAQRAGLYVTPINWHLTPDEAGYIIADCGAAAFFTSSALADVAERLREHIGAVSHAFMVDGATDGYVPYEPAIASHPAKPLTEEIEGSFMFYSSGTTGRPKGIMPAFHREPFGATGGRLVALLQARYQFSADTVYLCPAPLYHAAPLGWTTAAQRLGATVVVMEHFDPAGCLELIERHQVTHAQFVPTHFIRMLRLPETARGRYDTSSLQMVVHAAAPCPIDVKRQMIEWWGPIIEEFYAGSEGNGFCAIDSEQALTHPGSVGQALWGTIHILDGDGDEAPVGGTGQIWFESEHRFEYHNDPDTTAGAYNNRGWSSLGDIGYVDSDGFLYLTDRASHMIISGGVNIYPQEVENELALHPEVADAAVIGVPNEDFGEEVKAVVIAADPTAAGAELERRLIDFCRSHLAHYKCPVSIDFVEELPRLPTGKLLKRQLRDTYWSEQRPTA